MSPPETIGHKEFAGKFWLSHGPTCDAAQSYIEEDNSLSLPIAFAQLG